MKKRKIKIRIGLRTIKTVAAVIIAMIIVDLYGTTASKLLFAMSGAMAAVQLTFKDSLESCLTQIVGVFLGALAGVLLRLLPLPSLVATAIGIVLVITLYNALNIRFSPSLPCFIVVMICNTPDVQPMTYALGRIWDTAIGLGVGMAINTLVFPYDNSHQIRLTANSLDKEVILFLEDMFDGDNVLPDTDDMISKIDDMARQLKIFENQRLITHLKRQRRELETFRACEGKARDLVAHMEVLCRMEQPGRLNQENRCRLGKCGADIQDDRQPDLISEADVITNYHVSQILTLRDELLIALRGNIEVEQKESDLKGAVEKYGLISDVSLAEKKGDSGETSAVLGEANADSEKTGADSEKTGADSEETDADIEKTGTKNNLSLQDDEKEKAANK